MDRDGLAARLQRGLYRRLPRGLRRELGRRAPLLVREFTLDLPDGRQLLLEGLDRSTLLRRLFWDGWLGYEPLVTRLVQALAADARTILNIGSYVGTFALIAARASPFAQIHSIEPVPDNHALQARLIARNGLEGIRLHRLALGATQGEATFYVARRKDGRLIDIGALKNRFAAGARFAGRDHAAITVPVTTLDQLAEAEGLSRVDLIKIDTEETEYDVLSHGAALLERDRPDIIVEVIFGNPDTPRLDAFLRGLGYRFHDIGWDGLPEVAELGAVTGAADDPRRRRRRGGMTDRFCSCRSAADLAVIAGRLAALPRPPA